jgi:hypothetical protein
MKKSLHKVFLFSVLFFAITLFSEKSFGQSTQAPKAMPQTEATKKDSVTISKEQSDFVPGLAPGFHKWIPISTPVQETENPDEKKNNNGEIEKPK